MTEQNTPRDGWRKKIERYVDGMKSNGLVAQALAMLHRTSRTEQQQNFETNEKQLYLTQDQFVVMQHNNELVGGQITLLRHTEETSPTRARFFLVPKTHYNEMNKAPLLTQGTPVQITIPGQFIVVGRVRDIKLENLAYFRVVSDETARFEEMWSWPEDMLEGNNN